MKRLMFFAAVALLAACSGPPAAQPSVASLNSPSVPAGAPASVAEDGRPRHRLDETKEESRRVNQPWQQCMKDHGADLDQQPGSIEGAKKWSEEHKAARDACRAKLPLPPWSMDRANPEYKDNMHAVVECMKRGGVRAAVSDDPEMAWTFTSDEQPPNHHEIIDKCEREVLGPKER